MAEVFSRDKSADFVIYAVPSGKPYNITLEQALATREQMKENTKRFLAQMKELDQNKSKESTVKELKKNL